MQINNKGMSFIEILVAVGMLGLVAAGIMSVSSIQSQSSLGSRAAIDLAKSFAVLSQIIKEPSTCRANLSGAKLNDKIPQIVDQNGNILFEIGKNIEGDTYKITDIVFSSFDLTKRQGILELTYQKDKSFTGVAEIKKRVSFYPNLNAGAVEDCLMGLNIVAESLQDHFCRSIYGDIDPRCDYMTLLKQVKRSFCDSSSRPWLRWNAASEKCEALQAKAGCASGWATGFDNDGVFSCFTP